MLKTILQIDAKNAPVALERENPRLEIYACETN